MGSHAFCPLKLIEVSNLMASLLQCNSLHMQALSGHLCLDFEIKAQGTVAKILTLWQLLLLRVINCILSLTQESPVSMLTWLVSLLSCRLKSHTFHSFGHKIVQHSVKLIHIFGENVFSLHTQKITNVQIM